MNSSHLYYHAPRSVPPHPLALRTSSCTREMCVDCALVLSPSSHLVKGRQAYARLAYVCLYKPEEINST